MFQIFAGFKCERCVSTIIVLCLASAAAAQNSYISATGTFTSSAAPYQELLTTFSDGTANTFYRTWAWSGGTNAAGDVIAPGGIDSFIEVFDPSNTSLGWNDDRGSGGLLDSLLSPFGSTGGAHTFLPALGNGQHRLRMDTAGAIGDGHWALDMSRDGTFQVDALNGQSSSLSSLKFGSDQPSGAIVKLSGTLTLSGALHIQSGGLLDAQSGIVRSKSLTISGDGRLDLHNRGAIIDYGTDDNPTAAVKASVATGYAGGAWTGDGILSTDAATSNGLYGVGYVDNTILHLQTFAGQSVSDDALLIRMTYSGDANLDGRVDVGDLSLLARSWQSPGDWINGDFNYDGAIDADDLGMLASNWAAGTTDPLVLEPFDQAVAEFNLDADAVPEPACAILWICSAGILLHRRRRASACPS